MNARETLFNNPKCKINYLHVPENNYYHMDARFPNPDAGSPISAFQFNFCATGRNEALNKCGQELLLLLKPEFGQTPKGRVISQYLETCKLQESRSGKPYLYVSSRAFDAPVPARFGDAPAEEALGMLQEDGLMKPDTARLIAGTIAMMRARPTPGAGRAAKASLLSLPQEEMKEHITHTMRDMLAKKGRTELA